MKTPEIGQSVLVPWGLDVLPGTVIRVYNSGAGPRVVVRIDVPGVSGAEIEDVTVTLPVDALEQEGERGSSAAPGEWVHAQAYERELVAHITLMLRSMEQGSGMHLTISNRHYGSDDQIDFTIQTRDGWMIDCEAKYSKRLVGLSSISRLLSTTEKRLVPVLFITNIGLSGPAANELRNADTQGKLNWVLWRGERDNTALEQTILSLLPKSSTGQS